MRHVIDGGRKEIDFGPIVPLHRAWMDRYAEGRFVCLRLGDEYIYIRCYNRFQEPYRRALKRRLIPLRRVPFTVKIELTIDPKQFIWFYDEIGFLARAWNKLRSALWKRYGPFEFLCILEFQRSGRPHLHILIKGFRFVPHSWIAELWKGYGGGFVWIMSVQRGRINAVKYVLKYVTKSFSGVNPLYGAILFASNKRLFSMSRGLGSMLGTKKSEKKGYEFLGLVSAWVLIEYCEENNLFLGDYLIVVPSFKEKLWYPNMFPDD